MSTALHLQHWELMNSSQGSLALCSTNRIASTHFLQMSFAVRVILILLVIAKDISILYLEHLWTWTKWTLFGTRPTRPSNDRSQEELETRIGHLERKLKKQEAEIAKFIAQARGPSRRRMSTSKSMDVKKEFEQVVRKFCEEQKNHGLVMVKNVCLEEPAAEEAMSIESPVHCRLSATFKVSNSP